MLTRDGRPSAVFYAKLANRVVTPLFAADQPNSPAPLRRALLTSTATGAYMVDAGLKAA